MKIEWPTDPTEANQTKYLKALHECQETGVEKLGRRITLTGVGAAVALVISLSGAVLVTGKWFAAVDTSLKTLTSVVADQKAQSAKTDAIWTELKVLEATSQENNTALLGPNSQSNKRAARRAAR